jgi:hypothetical protein
MPNVQRSIVRTSSVFGLRLKMEVTAALSGVTLYLLLGRPLANTFGVER